MVVMFPLACAHLWAPLLRPDSPVLPAGLRTTTLVPQGAGRPGTQGFL